MSLIADRIANCPEIIKAKAEILKRIQKNQEKICGIKEGDPALKQPYEELIAAFNNHRGQPLFYPLIGSGAGKGALVELADGSVKYDCVTGIGVHFGHGHPLLLEAALDAALQDVTMQGNLLQNRDSAALVELLTRVSGIDHCLLTTSGAMANENGLKLLFQHRHPAHRILAFEGCFMGRTLALANITDKPQYREGLPTPLPIDYLPFYDWKEPEKSTQRAVEKLRHLLKSHPDGYACMCMELIQGENGFYPGSAPFFHALCAELKAHAIPILIDEVQTFGRTTHLFAFQHFNLEAYADVVTIGKLSQVCATLYRKEFSPKPGLLSQTFTSSTAAIRCAHTLISTLLEEGYLGENGRNMQIRKQVVDHLKAIASRHPEKLSGPFGCGLMIACTPLKGEHKAVLALAKRLFDTGIITFLAGTHPTRIRFLLPAGGITEKEIDEVMTLFEKELGA